jgi:hypothetical protein
MDIKTPFLNGDLEHVIYMRPPGGCADYGKERVIWKLERSLYGLKQASRAWYEKVKEEFRKLGFLRCDSDHAVFVYHGKGKIFCIIVLYIDDLMILSNNLKLLSLKKAQLMKALKMKDLGEIHWFLGLKITRNRLQRLIYISQSCYVKDILSRFNFTNSHPISTPIASNFKLP